MSKSFSKSVSEMPPWVQIWMKALGPVPTLAFATWLFNPETRSDGVLFLSLFFVAIGGTLYLYSRIGMVRLIGLPHVVGWTPLAFLLGRRLLMDPPPPTLQMTGWVALSIITISLLFDASDVARWVMGDRGMTAPDPSDSIDVVADS